MRLQTVLQPIYNDTIARAVAGVLMGLLLAQIVVAVRISTIGKTLTKLDNEWSAVSRENHQREEEMAGYTALSTVASRAAALGLVHPSQILYLTPGTSQARAQDASKQLMQ